MFREIRWCHNPGDLWQSARRHILAECVEKATIWHGIAHSLKQRNELIIFRFPSRIRCPIGLIAALLIGYTVIHKSS
ncbi:hypothetical protein D3C75_936380 [compost metagenome]